MSPLLFDPTRFKKILDYFFLLVAWILLLSDIFGGLNFVSHHFIRVNFIIHKTFCNTIIIVLALWSARQQTEYLFRGQVKRNCKKPVWGPTSDSMCYVNILYIQHTYVKVSSDNDNEFNSVTVKNSNNQKHKVI